MYFPTNVMTEDCNSWRARSLTQQRSSKFHSPFAHQAPLGIGDTSGMFIARAPPTLLYILPKLEKVPWSWSAMNKTTDTQRRSPLLKTAHVLCWTILAVGFVWWLVMGRTCLERGPKLSRTFSNMYPKQNDDFHSPLPSVATSEGTNAGTMLHRTPGIFRRPADPFHSSQL